MPNQDGKDRELELPLERGRCGLGLVPVEVTGDVWVVPDGDLHGDLTFPQGGLAGWRMGWSSTRIARGKTWRPGEPRRQR